MALPSQTRKAPKGGSGTFSLNPLTTTTTTADTVGAPITSIGYTKGIANIPVSAFTGTVEKENLAFTADVEIFEEAFNDSINALTFSGAITEAETKYENGETKNAITVPSNALYALLQHYSPANTEASSLTRVTSMVGVLVDESGDVVTTTDVYNVTKVSFKAVAAPSAVTIPVLDVPTNTYGMMNADVVTPEAASIAADTYGTVTWAASVA
jgi:hypothetical protein